MSIDYDDFIDEIKDSHHNRDTGFTMPLFPVYNNLVGNILPNTLTVIGGLPSSGRTTFMDQNYALNPLYQWHNTEDDYDLRIMYFSFKSGVNKKMKNFLTNYAMTFEQMRFDISTLDSGHNRRFELENSERGKNVLDNSKSVFKSALMNKNLQVFDGEYSPNIFYNHVITLMEELGEGDEHKFEFHDPLTSVILLIDDADYVIQDPSQAGKVHPLELQRQLLEYILKLKKVYNMSVVVNIPVKLKYSFMPADSIPHHTQLGLWGSESDVGTIIYCPIRERTFPMLTNGDDPQNYIVNGIDYLRFWFIVRNNNGPETDRGRFLMMGGSNYSFEFLDTDENILHSSDDLQPILFVNRNPY